MVLLNLKKPASWPTDLRSYLESCHDLFLGWERGGVEAPLYHQAIYGLIDALQPYVVTGWHCSRLIDAELRHILREAMQHPNSTMLYRRIDALVAYGDLEPDIALRLKKKKQGTHKNRAGMIWFWFFHSRLAGERVSGISFVMG